MAYFLVDLESLILILMIPISHLQNFLSASPEEVNNEKRGKMTYEQAQYHVPYCGLSSKTQGYFLVNF